jgi:antitoxin CptB
MPPDSAPDAALFDTSVGDPCLDGLDASQALSAQALSKLRWRCRRGLLENDLFIARFFERHAHHLTVGQAQAMYALMDLSDNDLMDVLLKRRALSPDKNPAHVREVLEMLWA